VPVVGGNSQGVLAVATVAGGVVTAADVSSALRNVTAGGQLPAAVVSGLVPTVVQRLETDRASLTKPVASASASAISMSAKPFALRSPSCIPADSLSTNRPMRNSSPSKTKPSRNSRPKSAIPSWPAVFSNWSTPAS